MTEKSSDLQQNLTSTTENSLGGLFQTQNSFCEEIDAQEIKRKEVTKSKTVLHLEIFNVKKLQVLGRGTYGLVQKAEWRDKIVAVKLIDSEMERRAFFVEVTINIWLQLQIS